MTTGGYIYAIGAEGTSLVKIGCTKHVEQRRRILQTGQPFPLHLLATIPVEKNIRRIEKQIHAFLAEERRRGEWFDVVMDAPRLEMLILRAVEHLAVEEEARRQKCSSLPRTMSLFVSIGEKIKRERERRQWSQHDLSRIANVRQALISELEAGKKNDTTVSVLSRLARALGVTLDYLAGMYDEHGGKPAAMELVGA